MSEEPVIEIPVLPDDYDPAKGNAADAFVIRLTCAPPLTLPVVITPEVDANVAGEAILAYINPNERWGRFTTNFERGDFHEIPGLAPLDVRTICCGCFANVDGDRVEGWRSDALNLELYRYADGDVTIVIRHPSLMLENSDAKKSDHWAWVDARHWSKNLPEGYYERR